MVLFLAFVNSTNLYMALNMHLMLGMRRSTISLLVVASLLVTLSMISTFAIKMAKLLWLCYMWIISLSLVTGHP
jgi:hypothetical protein